MTIEMEAGASLNQCSMKLLIVHARRKYVTSHKPVSCQLPYSQRFRGMGTSQVKASRLSS